MEIIFQRPLQKFSQLFGLIMNKGRYGVPALLLLSGFCIRLLYSYYGPVLSKHVWSDMEIYARISENISLGIWKESHFFQSIGYPIFVASLRQIITPAGYLLSIIQAICSSLTLFFMYRLTLQSLGKNVALLALIVGSVHLPWILLGNFALPETIFTTLLSSCALLSYEILSSDKPRLRSCVLFGFLFIMAFWLKGTHALWAPLFFGALLLKKKTAALKPILIMGTFMAIGLAGHGYLTYKKIGKIQLSASTSGLNFIEGKCPAKKNTDSSGYTWQSPLYFQLGFHGRKTWQRPFTESSYYMKQGLDCIQKDPFIMIQSFESIPYLFFGNVMWPFNQMPVARYARIYELFFAVFLIVGISVFIARVRNTEQLIIWLIPVLSIFLTVYIFKSEIRYRIPFDIWFIPIAVKGWLGISRTQ